MNYDLLNRISRARSKINQPRKNNEFIKKSKELSILKVIIDFVSAIGVGGFIGYQIDQYLNTSPIFLIICTISGMSAGILNLYRSIK